MVKWLLTVAKVGKVGVEKWYFGESWFGGLSRISTLDCHEVFAHSSSRIP